LKSACCDTEQIHLSNIEVRRIHSQPEILQRVPRLCVHHRVRDLDGQVDIELVYAMVGFLHHQLVAVRPAVLSIQVLSSNPVVVTTSVVGPSTCPLNSRTIAAR
jgi:hypothetical protein